MRTYRLMSNPTPAARRRVTLLAHSDASRARGARRHSTNGEPRHASRRNRGPTSTWRPFSEAHFTIRFTIEVGAPVGLR